MRFADLDAVTIDGFGTLVQLRDPAPALARALSRLGWEVDEASAREAFAAEGAYYRARSHLGRDAESLAALRRDCVRVFLDELEVEVEVAPESFVGDFLGALVFEPVPGAAETAAALRTRGLRLAVVANWDCALHDHLRALNLANLFDAVVTSADAGAPKPEPAIFLHALAAIGAAPERAVHVGDEPLDEQGARAAGMRFVPAPLATAFEGWS